MAACGRCGRRTGSVGDPRRRPADRGRPVRDRPGSRRPAPDGSARPTAPRRRAAGPYTRLDATPTGRPVNNEYLVWAALFLVVAGGALVWIVFADAAGDRPGRAVDGGAPDRGGRTVRGRRRGRADADLPVRPVGRERSGDGRPIASPPVTPGAGRSAPEGPSGDRRPRSEPQEPSRTGTGVAAGPVPGLGACAAASDTPNFIVPGAPSGSSAGPLHQ